jgi:E3 ubiquitin-protein ligase NEDD4
LVLEEAEEGVGSLGTEVTDSFELPCGCWESNPGPPEEQPVLETQLQTSEII